MCGWVGLGWRVVTVDTEAVAGPGQWPLLSSEAAPASASYEEATRPTIPTTAYTDLFYVLLPIIDSSYQYLLSQAGINCKIISNLFI